MFAQACKRSFGSSKVLFFRSVAYIELPNEAGELRVERFHMEPSMCKLIHDFDSGRDVIPKAGFLLKAPHGARRMEDNRARRARSRDKVRLAKLLGAMVSLDENNGAKRRGRYTDKPVAIDLLVRNGSGLVHFVKQKKAKR